MSMLLLLGPTPPTVAPSSMARIGLTYRGVSIQDLAAGIYLEIIRGLDETAEVRGSDTIVPWRPGRSFGDRVPDLLPLELEGVVTGDANPSVAIENSTFRLHADAFGVLFDPLYPGTLEATLEDGTVQSIVARTVTHTWDQLNPMVARVNVAMESVDPEWST